MMPKISKADTEAPMLLGYARTSTLEQVAGLEAQKRDLEALGCKKIFSEQTSSVGPRKDLEDLLEFARAGDTIVATKLDRLARSVVHLGTIIDHLKEKGVALRILDIGMDTSTATGELILNVMASVAQFERSMMLERQREGVAKAKAEGKYKGRKPTARAKTQEVREMIQQGIPKREIAKRLGIGERSVYRVAQGA
jgi:DNA invertase Pin-like site-specific DNA recombinase